MSNTRKKLYFVDGKIAESEDGASSGVCIEFDLSTQALTISSWYDSIVGTEPVTLCAGEFMEILGISQTDSILSRFEPSLRGAGKKED